ncbi:FecR family protein [Maribacter sp. 2308TA10-17]|uniref:FecR family protein n=1 Tax=Maribacter sp. 2308TA10-17 TaxID=3386276 RepID=UPI0039BD75B9
MEKFYNKDDFLAKWSSGDLSEEQKETFRQTEDYKYYAAILEGTDLLEVPAYDKEKNFERVQQKMATEKKVVQFIPKWAYAVAASVVILIGYTFFFNQTTSYETGFGEQLAIVLPDESEVLLNADSELEHKKKDWENKRTLQLDGEAFFKVKKGSTFTVQTDNGSVTVLGTQFTVTSDDGIFEAKCFEGKVRVTKGNLSEVLTKGKAVRLVDNSFENWEFMADAPAWAQEESSFKNAPLSQVIRALEKQFDVTINTDKIDKNVRFSGSFTHSDLQKALRTVFEPLEIKFTFDNENTIDLVIE